MITIAIAYSMGIILCYLLIRVLKGQSKTWGNVFYRVYCSFLWPSMLIALLFGSLWEYLKIKKPPKWL